MQHKDCRGLPLTIASADAAAAYDATLAAYQGLRADTGDRLKEALALDPDCPLTLTTRGYFMLLFAQKGLVAKAKDSLAAAEMAAAARGVTARERRHIAALRAWCAGDADTALAEWEAILAEHPRDVLAIRLAHFWHFYNGDPLKLRDSVSRVLRDWDESVPGYGFVLGCHAFGLEEAGDYAAAERAGRRAVELNPQDAWAVHAVAHVLEMQDRTSEGIAWLDRHIPGLAACNNFRFHTTWHRCLFYLEQGEAARVLELYDREVRPDSTPDYLDICNAVSLLWRLEEEGVDVGQRWAELAKQSATRTGEHLLVFADAHFALALGAVDTAGADAFVASARQNAGTTGTQARVMSEIGAALCGAVVDYRRGAFGKAVDALLPRRGVLRTIGGSHAQRDLFEKMLILAALADGRKTLAADLLADRGRQRPNNPWNRRLAARLAS
jgi:tetratricopeptide (TPR) repeat protein